jgi:alkyl sulfatase BDS1-like metallo-beta-lactamase superfamily hydrolase
LRQSKLNNNYGLYEVIPGIHQVRGLDLSDISFVRGKTGWIVFDPLVTTEVVRVAWNLFQDHVGEGLPVSAVIYSHTHGDHWGGVRGIVDEADVRSGYVGQGLGQAVSAGATGLIAPTKYIEKDIEELEVDGVRMVFQNTPNTEAPREMNTYLPDMKALWMAENVIASLHNIYTLRGAPVRDPLRWSKYIADALSLRRRGRGHVRVASLAALGQRPHSRSSPRSARSLRPHE